VDDAAVTERVREFYERHPYPPPVDSLDSYRRRWRSDDRARRRADHHLFWPARPFREDPSILIAGCGTSQAAKHAIRWPAARVTGIDLSATSIERTEELKRKYDLRNLELRQLPVERAGELGAEFDQIVCTGVLHHLADPDAGLRALRAALAPGGAIHLMVYAPYGRTGIYMIQDFCRRLGIGADEAEIAQLMAALEALPSGHPLETLLREAPDFRDASAIADALLHPRDRAYSVPQLFELLAGARLSFSRWVKQAPYGAECGVLTRIPQAERLARLPPAEQAIAAELFRGTMVRHSAIAHRDDDAARAVDFRGDAWHGYVPIRAPDTIAVEERLPAGAAAVLINRSHTYTDLYLPIDKGQKRLLDAVDGQRTIAEIARAQGQLAEAGPFFDRLYRHDQVVFDASAA
jgi:SAM-dependent methyltransferase